MNISTVTHKGLSFINMNKPSEEQMKFLNKNFGFSMLNLEDYLYKTQIPKIEIYKDYSLVVMDIPYIEKTKREQGATKTDLIPNVLSGRVPAPAFPKLPRKKRISVGEVDFFIGEDYLVVLHDEKTPQIDELFQMCKLTEKHRADLMGKGSVFLLYRIIDVLVDSSFSYLEDITNAIDYIDRQLDEKISGAVIEDISMTRRNIVFFETMIKPAIPIFADLEKGKYPKLNGEMVQYWSNILDHLQKIWDRLEDNKELIEGISRSYESFLSIRTNEVIAVLTVIFTYSIPATLVGTFYGMNILLPGGLDHGPWAFFGDYTTFIVLLILIAIPTLLMHLFFKKKGWV
jgi:magnesium transporter